MKQKSEEVKNLKHGKQETPEDSQALQNIS